MRSLRKFILAFALYVALVLDGSLALFLHQFMALGNAACLIMPIGMMLIALFDDLNNKEIWLAIGAGIVADIYFFGIIGAYAVILPIVTWLLQKSARFLPEVFWARILAVLLAVVIVCCYNWLILSVVGVIAVPIKTMLVSLLPTLAWSLVFAILSYPIWGRLARSHPFMVNLDNYQH
ncbi:rod shape-determining protein MreD [Lactobacillus sp. ESL0731]|uniref:rod shape-determining protein MreD n=1 Tax=unclassified Lactobacillus TaxID=2620435 RepID=UPI0023F786F4|nr:MULTISPECIES: rod shape-determining protein MreD [unclassified Lactobacillus]WEV51916.1 rod shape-determining protein MreD [Lactobacillus sp. ESL0700]WEV63047.1 rod shape-determining protein MreD [Lactobacillus sp. ESL0731]